MNVAPDRVCLVTGTSSGIGLAVAEELLRRGWDVAGVARRVARKSGALMLQEVGIVDMELGQLVGC